ncbi:DEAD/DEAH box helicase [Aureimonas fodinaquatilis]|uniref:DEAD/DEAH box helicase n=1 Tax=Aureimonas fodinaquatilis TaxID=2565783 RepID=A0A5B0DVM2_9HYPH|nr:DEAD/DEAH box helicase [Aureimonas fodinaquatilis]KAA0970526.1 DEAD/DEAH box helicase [Aureimonas fodinaquatilis]
MPFSSTHPALAKALAGRSYTQATPVQAATQDPALDGKDLIVSAKTGSGKTVAYGLAFASDLLKSGDTLPPAGEPLALVVAPTRELALQVRSELEWLYAEAGARVVSCVGGMDPRAEQRTLQAGAHIVVGTPGRLRDHLERGRLKIANLQVLVLDEADEMLNLGFREDLEFLLEATPSSRRTLLFSATLPKTVLAMAKRYQRQAQRLQVEAATGGHSDIEYRAVRIAPNEMEHAVVNLLRHADAPSAIVFCNTRETVRHLHAGLIERGFSAVSLSGELGQNERNHTMQALRDGRARVCVATDVAARGLDLPSLDLVVHAELPNDAETLQHRSGRTGRAGRKGVSVLLVPVSRRRKAERLLAEASVSAKWGAAPSPEEIRKLDDMRLASDPILLEPASEQDIATAQFLLESRSAEEIAAALVRIYRSRLPAPEDVFDPGFARDAKPDYGKDKKERRERPAGPRGATTWFFMNIGKRNNADPKWLLPMLCRRGRITRDDIGAIRIFERETKFEISQEAAQRFASAAVGTDGDDITIGQSDRVPGAADKAAPRRSKPPFSRDKEKAGKFGAGAKKPKRKG